MEFKVTTDLSVIHPQSIESNFKETKEWLQQALAPYQGMVVTEDAIAEAKTKRAEINKVKDALEDKRKAVKKQWLEPYMKWEEQVKELVSMCDETAKGIDSQVKKFENDAKEEKLNALKVYFNGQCSGLGIGPYVEFDQIFNPKWLNATCKQDIAMGEIRGILMNILDDLHTIRNLGSEFEPALLEEYKKTHDLRSILTKDRALKETQMREAELKRNRAPGTQGDMFDPPIPQKAPEKPVQRHNEPTAKKTEKVWTLRFEVKMTKSQMFELKDFFESHNIAYSKIS